MNLGERIYALRTERNLSQGDLADALDVSRQSISKWENNNSVPDLDKLIKLSTLFGVSLDELVKGEKTEPPQPEETPNGEVKNQPQPKETGFPPRKIAGTILLCMGFLVLLVLGVLGGFGGGLIYSAPFFLCGVACFVFRKHTGLWCCWAAALVLDVYIRWIFGHYGSFSQIPDILVSMIRGNKFMPVSVLSLILPAALCVLVIVTSIRLRRKLGTLSNWKLCCIIVWWGVVVIWLVVVLNSVSLPVKWGYMIVIDWVWLVLLTGVLTFTIQYVYTWLQQKKNV